MTEPAHAPSGLKVLVIGEDSILRWGVAQYLRVTLPSATVGEASSASEVLEMVRASAWNLIVLDLEGTGDLAPLDHLKHAVSDVPVLVLNVDPAPANSKAAIAAGATGYLSKGSAAPDWRTAVETVARGGRYPDIPASEQGHSQ
jgi:DNA-binding NarL/FixJ family response regulator